MQLLAKFKKIMYMGFRATLTLPKVFLDNKIPFQKIIYHDNGLKPQLRRKKIRLRLDNYLNVI